MAITGIVDAVVRTLSDERQVVNFAVAVNYTYKAKNGERVTQTDFFDCAYLIVTDIALYLTMKKPLQITRLRKTVIFKCCYSLTSHNSFF